MPKSDEQYELKEERSRKRARKNSDNECISKRWTQEQNEKYAEYLKDNEEFGNKQMRKQIHFYIKMAKDLDIAKNNVQCRSHHQKMLIKHKTIPAIINNILKESPNAATLMGSGAEKDISLEEQQIEHDSQLLMEGYEKKEQKIGEDQIQFLREDSSINLYEDDFLLRIDREQEDLLSMD